MFTFTYQQFDFLSFFYRLLIFFGNLFYLCFPRRAHDANLIKLAKKYLAEHDTKGIIPTFYNMNKYHCFLLFCLSDSVTRCTFYEV
jgi:hypothetical protein